jgi:hypothetical protein
MTGRDATEPVAFRTGLRFESILVNAERALALDLERARLDSDHSLSIGERAQAEVRTLLREYLPSGYGVGHGHVYDVYRDKSKQTDDVITTPDHPLSFPEECSGTYLVDGVATAGEVKATMSPKQARRLHPQGSAVERTPDDDQRG